jgi:hypothetical protein
MFNLWLVESSGAEPVYTEGQLYYSILYNEFEHPKLSVSLVGRPYSQFPLDTEDELDH